MKRRKGEKFCEWCGKWRPLKHGKVKMFNSMKMCRVKCEPAFKKWEKKHRAEVLRNTEAR